MKASEAALIRERIRDIKTRLPAHSVKPGMLQELEALEERLSKLEAADEKPS
jgi:hydroxymethylpyrimidine/phosphomethylpyrimidine kinase